MTGLNLGRKQNTHLSIYEHLPRDINVLADAGKYQEWARRVIPRITSPDQTCDDSQNAFETPRRQLHETPQHFDHMTSPRELMTSTRSNEINVRGRKVRPGLCRGSVCHAMRALKQEIHLPKAPVQSPVHAYSEVTRNGTSLNRNQNGTHPFYALAKRGPIRSNELVTSLPSITSASLLAAAPSSRQSHGRVPHRQQRRYFSISRPALNSNSSSFVLASLVTEQHHVTRSPRPTQHPPFLNKAPRSSALSSGLRQGPIGRSIPSGLEMNQTRNFVLTAKMGVSEHS